MPPIPSSLAARTALPAFLTLALLTSSSVFAQITPDESAKKLKPAEGLEATLWAAEPMVVNPTTMDIDSRGRVWITEGLNYRLSRGGNKRFHRIEDADKIKILEDTDGDGKADKMTVFADKVFPVPMGIAVEEFWSKEGKYKGCKVYVGNSPDILVLEDTDGDDKADKRYPLLTGFGGIDSDHGVHGMVLGLDGKLYFTHGDGCCSVQQDHSERTQNFDVTDKSNRHVTSDQLANTLRVNRDGTDFEIIADRQRNNYETCLNSFGNQFTSDNDDDGNRGSRVIWIMDGGKYGYRTPGSPRHWGEEVPGNVPKLVGTGNGSPCGVMVYEGDLLPKEYFGAVLEAEAGPRVINYFPLKRVGAAFRTEHKIMLSSDDPWFRPVDVTAAPDGSVFVADWYDGGVGGHAFQDQTTGRIYRVAPKGMKSKKVTYDFATIDGLIEALKSPVVATRDVARRLLSARGQEAKGALAQLFQKGGTIEKARALWVQDAVQPEVAAYAVLNDAAHNPPEVVEQAVRILGRDLATVGNVKVHRVLMAPAARHQPILKPLADQPDAGVRRELILAFRNLPTQDVGAALRKLAASWDGQDRWYLEALGLALRDREPEYLRELFDGKIFGEMDLTEEGKTSNVALPPYFPVDRNEAYLSVNDRLPPANALSKTLGLMWMVHRPEVLGLLSRISPSLKTPELLQAADDVVMQISDPAGAITLSEQVHAAANDPARRRQILATLTRKLEGAWRDAKSNPQVVETIRLSLGDKETRLQGLQMAAATEDASYADLIDQTIDDSKAPEDVRVAAVEALLVRAPKARATMERLIGESLLKKGSTPIAEAAVRALPKLGDARNDLKQFLTSSDAPLGLRREALRTFAQLKGGAKTLLTMAQEKALAEDLKTEAATLLRTDPDRGIRDEAAKVFPIKLAGGKHLPPFGELIRSEGNVDHGREVFFRGTTNTCGGCHRVQGQGQWVGPDLSTIGTKYGKDLLLRSILNPSEAISYNFRSLVLALGDGRVVTGLPVEESTQGVVLKLADGQRMNLKTSEIEDRKFSEISLMPDGLAETMGEQDLVDLLAYLATLKQPVSIVGQSQVAGPVGRHDEVGVVSKGSSAPISGVDGKSWSWKRLNANAEGQIRLADDGTYYVHVPVTSPSAQAGRLVFDSKGELSLWHNGRAIDLKGSKEGVREARLELPKGTSDVLIRVKAAPDTSLVTTIVADKPLEFSLNEATQPPGR